MQEPAGEASRSINLTLGTAAKWDEDQADLISRTLTNKE